MKRRPSLPPAAFWIAALWALPGCNGCSCGSFSSPSCSLGDGGGGGGGCGGGGSLGEANPDRPDALEPTFVDTGAPPPMPGGLVLAKLAYQPHGIAMLDGTLYVVDGDRIVSIFAESPPSTDGGTDAGSDADPDADLDASDDAAETSTDGASDAGNSPVIATGIGDVEGLAAFGDYLYWSRHTNGTPGAIVRMRVRPSISTPEDIAVTTSSNPLEGLVADATGVRWLEDMQGMFAWDGTTAKLVASAPIAPTARFSPIARAAGTTHFVAQDQIVSLDDTGSWSAIASKGVLALAADPLAIYAARQGSLGVDVGTLSKNGFTTYDTFGDVRAMALESGDLFVVDESRSLVWRVPTTQTSSTLLAAPAQPPHDVTASASYVYFTTVGAPSDVRRASR